MSDDTKQIEALLERALTAEGVVVAALNIRTALYRALRSGTNEQRRAAKVMLGVLRPLWDALEVATEAGGVYGPDDTTLH